MGPAVENGAESLCRREKRGLPIFDVPGGFVREKHLEQRDIQGVPWLRSVISFGDREPGESKIAYDIEGLVADGFVGEAPPARIYNLSGSIDSSAGFGTCPFGEAGHVKLFHLLDKAEGPRRRELAKKCRTVNDSAPRLPLYLGWLRALRRPSFSPEALIDEALSTLK